MIGMAKRSARLVVVAALLLAAVAGAAAGQASAAGVRPDDRAGSRGPGGVVAQSRVLRVVAPLTRTSSSFHWDDALVGAGVAAGFAVVLVLGGVGVRRHVRLAPQTSVPTSVERSL